MHVKIFYALPNNVQSFKNWSVCLMLILDIEGKEQSLRLNISDRLQF